MILSFTAIDTSTEVREFSCHLIDLEDALDVLSIVALDGHTIIKASVIDEGDYTELPVEAFDGQPLSDSTRKLKKQWQSVLKKPVRLAEPATNWRMKLVNQQLTMYETRIEQFVVLVDRFEQLRERAEQSKYYGSPGTTLINHYNSVLCTYRHCMDRAKAGHQQVQKKLSQLQQ